MNNNNNNNRAAADNFAHAESKAGRERQLQMDRTDIRPAPSRGGSTGYEVDERLTVLRYADEHGVAAAAEVHRPSAATIYRWYERLQPYRQTGNKDREDLVGWDQALLSMAVFIYPTASADQIAAFIVDNGGKVYERYTIYKRLAELELSRKKSSLEAYEGHTPVNMLREQVFFNSPPRDGVRGVRRHTLVDIDEARFSLQGKQSKYGWAGTPFRVRDTGHYTRRCPSINVILAVEAGNPALPDHMRGSTSKPRRWYMLTERNVDQHLFGDFIETVCRDVERNHIPQSDETRYLLWDNLGAHLTEYVTNIVEIREGPTTFVPIPRPPYKPRFAPVEYVFCQLACELNRRKMRHWTAVDLRTQLNNILLALGRDGKWNKTFAHCGY